MGFWGFGVLGFWFFFFEKFILIIIITLDGVIAELSIQCLIGKSYLLLYCLNFSDIFTKVIVISM